MNRFSKPTPRIHKIIGRIVTGLALGAEALAQSGYIDHKPQLKVALHIVSVVLGGQALYHGSRVEEATEDNPENNAELK